MLRIKEKKERSETGKKPRESIPDVKQRRDFEVVCFSY
jgi:hypothetical protein